MPDPSDRRRRWAELTALVDGASRKGLASLSVGQVKRLGHLYRQVTIDLSQARAGGADPQLVAYLNALAARAHGQVYAAPRPSLRALPRFIFPGFPRLLRRNWRPVVAAALVFFLASIVSMLAVVRTPELAYSLFDERVVEYENIRLEKQQGEYKGNFTFEERVSPIVAAEIIGNNVRVAILAFALGAVACVPGVLLLVYNGRMLGTLSGLVWNAGFFVDFYALILTHGVLELTAICVAGGAGLRLGWALIAPAGRPRADAFRAAAPDAFGLLAGSVLMLFVAGFIEAFVTPHFGQGVRWSVAGVSGGLFALYVAAAGGGVKRGSPQSHRGHRAIKDRGKTKARVED